jgi:GT2 family glycosyltransferase
MRRDLYLAAGGLDEKNLTVAFNDVDFCLRLRESGYRNVWTPFAELYHKESASRGEDLDGEKLRRFRAEIDYMRYRWARELDNDPFWNPNLSINSLQRILALQVRRRKSWGNYLKH